METPVEYGAANFNENQPATMMDTSAEIIQGKEAQAPYRFEPHKLTLGDIEQPFRQLTDGSSYTLEDLGEAQVYSTFADLPADLLADIDLSREQFKQNPKWTEWYNKKWDQTQLMDQVYMYALRESRGEILGPDELAQKENLRQQANDIGQWLKENKADSARRLPTAMRT